MIRFVPLFALLLFATASLAAEETPSLERVTRALEAPFGKGAKGSGAITGFRADFRQESRLASLDRTQRGKGTVAVTFEPQRTEGPAMARFRWDYEQPARQEIVSDGRTLWVYLPENRQVIESTLDLSETRPDDPVTFLTGLGNLSRDFQIAWAQPRRDADGHWQLELRPRRPSPLIETLQVSVHKDALQDEGGKVFPLRSTRVLDPGGNTTLIEFSNVRINPDLAPSLFRFSTPAGVEVIRSPDRPGGL